MVVAVWEFDCLPHRQLSKNDVQPGGIDYPILFTTGVTGRAQEYGTDQKGLILFTFIYAPLW